MQRLKAFALEHIEREVEPRTKQFAFTLFHAPSHVLTLEDQGVGADASVIVLPLEAQLSCGPSTGRETPLLDLDVKAAGWGGARSISAGRLQLILRGGLEYGCADVRTRFSSNYMVQVEAVWQLGRWVLDPSTLVSTQNGIRSLL